MPGINFIFCTNKLTTEANLNVKTINKHLCYNPDYSTKKFYQDDYIYIISNNYSDYPISFYETQDFIKILEGYIYNYNHQQVFQEMEKLIHQNLNVLEKINSYILFLDGDFNFYIFNKKKRKLFVVSDSLGRLPFYYYKSNDQFIGGRELKFVVSMSNSVELEKNALIDYLLFMIPANQLTLNKNVFKLPPASILEYNENGLTISAYKTWNYEIKKNKKHKYKTVVSDLTDLFLEGLKNRANCFQNKNFIISLSGGLDSRTIAGGLKKLGQNAKCYSFLTPDKSNLGDFTLSKQIAKYLDLEWNGCNLPEIDIKRIQRLIFLKDAQNYAAVANLIDFFEYIQSQEENPIYFTGDGGRIFKYELPRTKIPLIR